MADQHGQVPVGHVDDVNMDTEWTQDPHEVTMECEEEAMGEMENNAHPRSLENVAPIMQNAGLSPPVLPENGMMLLMRQLMAQMKMSSEENNSRMEAMSRKTDVKGEETNSRMEAMNRKMNGYNSRIEVMDENSRKIDVMGD